MRRPYSYTEQKFKVNFGNILCLSSVQADWNEENESAPGFIRNKPKLIAGDNILLTKDGNNIIISVKGTVIDPDEPEGPDTPPSPDETIVEIIINNKLTIFTGDESSVEAVPFKVLDGNTAPYTAEGFYVIEGETKQAGYQVVFEKTPSGVPQVFMVPKDAVIINAWQYQPILNQWLSMGFDETYWIYTEDVIQTINGEEVVYSKYIYNSELWGDPITATEYWRFEVEVK